MNELTLVKDQTIIDLESKLQNSLKYAKELIVNDENSAKSASDSMGLLKQMGTKLDDRRKELVKPYQKSCSDFKAEIDAIIAISDEAGSITKVKYLEYCKQREIKLREEAQAEQARIIADEKAKAELIVNDILETADKLGMNSLVDQAEQVEAESAKRIEQLQKTNIDIASTKTSGSMYGTSFRDNWSAEVVDIKTALEWVIKGERWEAVTFESKFLKNIATNLKVEQTLNGIKISNNKSLVVR